MKQYGNIVSNAHYNPNETKNPPPVNSAEAERDSELEKFIRGALHCYWNCHNHSYLLVPDKYEFKQFVPDKAAIAARLLGPSQSASSRLSVIQPKRSMTTSPSLPAVSSPTTDQPSDLGLGSSSLLTAKPPTRSASHPLLSTTPTTTMQTQPFQTTTIQTQPFQTIATQAQPFQTTTQHPVAFQAQPPQPNQQPMAPSANPVWNDLVALQTPAVSSSLPLQYSQSQTMGGLSATPTGFNPSASSGSLGAMSFGGVSSPMVMSPPMNTGFVPSSNPFQQQQQPALTGASSFGNPFGAGTNPFQQQQQFTGMQQPFTGIQQAPFSGVNTQMQVQPQPTGNPFGNPFQTQGVFQPQPQQQQSFLQTPQFGARTPSPSIPIGGGLGMNPSQGLGQSMLSASPGNMGMGMSPGMTSPSVGMGMSNAPTGMGMGQQGMMQMQQPFGQQPFGQQQQQQQPFGSMGMGMGGMASSNPFNTGWQTGQQNWGGM
jgi:stromal membrane-associated protein